MEEPRAYLSILSTLMFIQNIKTAFNLQISHEPAKNLFRCQTLLHTYSFSYH